MKKGLLVSTVVLSFLLFAAPASAENEPEANAALKHGMSGEEVSKVQSKLLEFGYYEGTPDGEFGMMTEAAVMDFQIDAGLEPDGVVGQATLTAIKEFKPGKVTASRGASEGRRGLEVAAFARRFLGVPYVWAGASPSGFDCSGFMTYVYRHFGISIPRMADEQYEVGIPVSKYNLRPGDMVFFSTYEPGPSHVGIYIGDGQFIHASSGAGEVTITPLAKTYYVERYLGARRVTR